MRMEICKSPVQMDKTTDRTRQPQARAPDLVHWTYAVLYAATLIVLVKNSRLRLLKMLAF